MASEGLAAWLRLTLTPGVGNESARKLLATFGLPEAIWAASESALRQVVRPSQASALLSVPPEFPAQWARTQAWLAGEPDSAQAFPAEEGAAHATPSRAIVTLGDPGYPPALLETEDPPLLLYVMGRGSLASLPSDRCIAMVGSRNPTPQGAENARLFAQALASAGLTVVSGLALGIDGAAHEGALAAAASGTGHTDAVTVAVVGTGLDRVYPKQHRDLAHRIAMHGLLVSEYPLGTPPLSPNFPQRNRLIAGLSRATLVVEAALKSGSLITARMASEQGRDVLAIPGSIHATQSRGCHALIKQGAKLVESASDVLEEFGVTHVAGQAAHPASATAGRSATGVGVARPVAGPEPEGALLQALGYDPVGLDALQARTGLPTPVLQAELLSLELAGWVSRLPGGLFQRCAAA